MGQVRVFTAARSKQIEDTTVVGGYIDGMGNLILQTRIGGEVNAGPVIGPQGIPGNGFNSVLMSTAFDFNDLKNPGLYHVVLNAVAAACTNGPTFAGFATGQSGYLLVEGNGTTNIKQTWTNYNNPAEVVVRSYFATWFTWRPPVEWGSSTQPGIMQLSTNAETQTGTAVDRAVTPASLHARTATETRTGIVELATTTEASTGTDTTRAVTAAGVKATLDAMAGLRPTTVIYQTSSGAFTKASYPGLKAVRVSLVGGGGGSGGGGAATMGTHSVGGGGGGGGYASKLILAANLATSETITIGSGGSAGPAAASSVGGNGGTTSFGSQVVATGGKGGTGVTAVSLYISALAGDGGSGTSGDILIGGSPGGLGTGYATLAAGGIGGASFYGPGGASFSTGASTSSPGNTGGSYGGGASGCAINQNVSASVGSVGANGIVIIEVYV